MIPCLIAQPFLGNRFAMPARPTWVRAMIPERVMGTYMLLKGGQPVYVGRSDHCLRDRLAGHELLGRASHFAWEACPSPLRAFLLESFWYDKLRDAPGFLNDIHPAQPAGNSYPCPYCALTPDKVSRALEGIRNRATTADRRST
jgi:hypothetical protein